MRELARRLVDLREGEARPAAQAFVALFGLVAAHTILETARDALFLAKLRPERLALVYAIVALVTLPAAALNTRFAKRFGKRNALIFTLLAASYGAALFHLEELTPRVLFGLYVFCALVGTLLGVQFWMFATRLFTVSQGKRLFGPIASGGVAGAALGAGAAAIALPFIPTASLLLVAAVLFLATALFLTTVEADQDEERRKIVVRSRGPAPESALALLRHEPYLRELAAFVSLSTAALLVTDYVFKSVAAHSIPKAELGAFFARTYAALNVASLAVQLFVAGRVLRRLGVVAALVILPILLVASGAGIAAFGGVLALALLAKGADGSLRYSLHRVGSELLWMPLSGDTRDRGKALLDTVFGRVVQAITAGGLLLLGALELGSPRVLGILVVVLASGWLVVVARLRRSYLDLFRQALARGTLDPAASADELDLTSVETVMDALSSRDARRVLAAMDLLADKQRSRLIPGLILYHESPEVLVRALEIVASPDRTDWPPLAERLLGHAAEDVRVAAVRALARIGSDLALARTLEDESPAVRAHAAFWALRNADERPETTREIRDLLAIEGPDGAKARAALLDAIRDAPDPRFADLVLALARERELVARAAEAMTKIRDARFVPVLIGDLARRDVRGVAREALFFQGAPALDALARALRDPATDARLRLHLPESIARFGSQRAADVLAEHLSGERSAALRHRALRGLGQVVETASVKVDEAAVEAEAQRCLVEHLRLLALAIPLDEGRAGPAGEMLRGLVGDLQRRALARAFRLLGIVHPTEDIEGAYLALQSTDKHLRAQAMEFLDTLTLAGDRASQGHRALRDALRLVADDLGPDERVKRALERQLLASAPADEDEALAALLDEGDRALATVAEAYARAIAREPERAARDAPRAARLVEVTDGE